MTPPVADDHQPTWAFLFGQPGADPLRDRATLDHPTQRTLLVPLPDEDEAVSLVDGLIEDDGVQLIELCGGFSTTQAARVVKAVAGRVPVGHVTYALESVRGAAAYQSLFE